MGHGVPAVCGPEVLYFSFTKGDGGPDCLLGSGEDEKRCPIAWGFEWQKERGRVGGHCAACSARDGNGRTRSNCDAVKEQEHRRWNPRPATSWLCIPGLVT